MQMSSLLDSPNTPDPDSHEHATGCVGCLDRRQMLKRAGLLAAGVAAGGVLAACGRRGGSTNDGTSSGNTGGRSGALAKVSDVPEGGALSVKDADGNELLL